MEALDLAILFHETYERLAPNFGYETRTETRTFDPTTPNGRLMVAVCGEILNGVKVLDLADSLHIASSIMERLKTEFQQLPEGVIARLLQADAPQ